MNTKIACSFVSLVIAVVIQSTAAWAEVSVKNAWIRSTTLSQKATGAFMTITSSEAASLVSATSPIAGKVELHEMQMEGGAMMRMRRVENINLPANKAVELGPGGYHVMLMELRQRLDEGKVVPLNLIISTPDGRRSEVAVQVPVAAITAESAPAHRHH